MLTNNLAEVVNDIEGAIVIKKRSVIGSVVWPVRNSATIEVELRDVVVLNRIGEQASVRSPRASGQA